MKKILLRIWNWLRHYWRRRRVAAFVPKDYSVDVPIPVEEKAPMVRCYFCHRRTRLGRPCCNWRYLAIAAASLHIGGRLHPHRGFTDRTSGHARASGQRRFGSRMANRRRMRERSIKINRGLL